MRKIKMTIGGVAITAELFDTPTAYAILRTLPFSSIARTWGEEVYFDTPVRADDEADARIPEAADAGLDQCAVRDIVPVEHGEEIEVVADLLQAIVEVPSLEADTIRSTENLDLLNLCELIDASLRFRPTAVI